MVRDVLRRLQLAFLACFSRGATSHVNTFSWQQWKNASFWLVSLASRSTQKTVPFSCGIVAWVAWPCTHMNLPYGLHARCYVPMHIILSHGLTSPSRTLFLTPIQERSQCKVHTEGPGCSLGSEAAFYLVLPSVESRYISMFCGACLFVTRGCVVYCLTRYFTALAAVCKPAVLSKRV